MQDGEQEEGSGRRERWERITESPRAQWVGRGGGEWRRGEKSKREGTGRKREGIM